jgi:hypothetical protein
VHLLPRKQQRQVKTNKQTARKASRNSIELLKQYINSESFYKVVETKEVALQNSYADQFVPFPSFAQPSARPLQKYMRAKSMMQMKKAMALKPNFRAQTMDAGDFNPIRHFLRAETAEQVTAKTDAATHPYQSGKRSIYDTNRMNTPA